MASDNQGQPPHDGAGLVSGALFLLGCSPGDRFLSLRANQQPCR